jgi:glycosyltransferase involved in cell wall biosynthesis
VRIAWWASEPDRGVYDAMNSAVRRARGAFVYFLGADDVLLPGFARALDALASERTVYYGDVVLSSSGARYAGPFDAAKLARTNICHQAIFYPRHVFDRRAFDLRFPRLADWAFNMACWSDPELSFHYLDIAIAAYNDAGGMSAAAMDWAFYDAYPELLRRHFPLRARWRPLAMHALSRAYRACVGRATARPGRLQG